MYIRTVRVENGLTVSFTRHGDIVRIGNEGDSFLKKCDGFA